jgi:hypothetical protein
LNKDTNAEFKSLVKRDPGEKYLLSLRSENDWPDEIRTWKWVKIENQGNQGSCQGNALSSGHEFNYYLATGARIQFSRQHAYRGSQKLRGINGDSGSVCSDGIRLLTQTGLCLETLWPYPRSYQRDPPNASWEEVIADAGNYLAEDAIDFKSYDDMLKHLMSGKGPAHLGFMWSDIIDQQAAQKDGVIEQFRVSGPVGGHSVEGLAVCRKHPETGKKLEDSQGRPYIGIANSWDTRWGWNGWGFWSPAAIDAMLNHQYTEAAGVWGMKLGPKAVVPKYDYI